jgi:alkylated DNA repair protein (DNA oxidative demethylase)
VTGDLFERGEIGGHEPLAPGACVLRAYALAQEDALLEALEAVFAAAAPRRMSVPGGHRMSVAMTNSGALGWVADASGYRYVARDPLTDRPWPALPKAFEDLAIGAAQAAGFDGFRPDACLVNVYEPGARLSLHRDADEPDRSQPIVSASLGLPAVFLFGGLRRTDATQAVPLMHGDVVVWGGPSRLRYHGVRPLRAGVHPRLGARRVNLTFRKAGPPV